MKEKIIEIAEKMKELHTDVDICNYELVVDSANLLLKELEPLLEEKIMDEIYGLTQIKEQVSFSNQILKVFAPYAVDNNNKVDFFKNKLNKIITYLESLTANSNI